MQKDQIVYIAPAPRPGFAEEALDYAWATAHGQEHDSPNSTSWQWAVAASLVLAVLVSLQTPWVGRDTISVTDGSNVNTATQSVRQVDLMMVSDIARPDAVITLQLDGHVRLVGYPADNSISWRAPLDAGNNRLTLPVQLQGSKQGVILVAIKSKDLSSQMMLAVDQEDSPPPMERSI